jgi:hypothetical protein
MIVTTSQDYYCAFPPYSLLNTPSQVHSQANKATQDANLLDNKKELQRMHDACILLLHNSPPNFVEHTLAVTTSLVLRTLLLYIAAQSHYSFSQQGGQCNIPYSIPTRHKPTQTCSAYEPPHWPAQTSCTAYAPPHVPANRKPRQTVVQLLCCRLTTAAAALQRNR